MDAAVTWAKLTAAADALAGLDGASISFCLGEVGPVREMAALGGLTLRCHSYSDNGELRVIEAFNANRGGVEIRGQGSRPLEASDLKPTPTGAHPV